MSTIAGALTAPEMLHSLREARVCEAIDEQLAGMLVRRGGEAGERALAIALAAAFTSRARGDGHSAITLAQLAQQVRVVQGAGTGAIPFALPVSDEGWWARTLEASPLVSDGAAMSPLVLRDSLLQLRRYHDAEARIAARVRELTLMPLAAGLPGFSIITGGPGTGKTTSVAQKLVELSVKEPGLRVALAAPTGKAAARLTESIVQRVGGVENESGRRRSAPGEAKTLHRLLRYSPGRDRFRANETDPLDDDLVIVDEASMVDVLMLDALLRALKPGARLMLVGDHNQLASIDAGDVLGALCRAAQSSGAESPMGKAVTWLTRSWRFEQQPGIGVLASAVLAGDADAVFAVCGDAARPEVRLRPPATSMDALLEPVILNLERCLAASSPTALLDALETFRILAPEREGRLGVHGINAAVERWLARRGHAVHEPWYHGRPVLVTANDYSIDVFNGDLGVVWREAGHVAVHFRGRDGSTRVIAPVRLPAVETAWAMTVHKAQGSEFDEVLVVVPDYESRVTSRELLYTAVTRARRGVSIAGGDAAIRVAVGRSVGRTSGLELRLGEART